MQGVENNYCNFEILKRKKVIFLLENFIYFVFYLFHFDEISLRHCVNTAAVALLKIYRKNMLVFLRFIGARARLQ